MADELYEPDTALDEQPRDEERLAEVYKRAMRRFDQCAEPTRENRAQSLAARRFITIPGAQWEDDWGVQFDASFKLEVDFTAAGVRKIEQDYRQNRIVPDFRPDGKNANPQTAETLDGLHRADSYRFKSQQARDNAAFEAIAGGFGAYRLTNEWEDEGDKDNDHQRINPASIIVDADQSVFFDINARLYDKSDARFAFVRVNLSPEVFAEEYEGAASSFPEGTAWQAKDWFTPDTVAVAEYYEREEADDTLWVLIHTLSGEEKRLWSSDLEKGDLASWKAQGWQAKAQRRKRCRIHKYVISGAEVLEDRGYIAGECIPIVPVYGKRYFVDGIERWSGYVQEKMDRQRLYNAGVSKLAEIHSLAPREVPVFAPEQIDAVQAEQWARSNIDRLPFLTAHPLLNPDGTVAHLGPIDKVQPPQLGSAHAAIMQIAREDLVADLQDADQVKANTSAEAMDIAATRVDAKSGIYLDNIRQSVQREGEIYFSMAREIYVEEDREVETMDEEGDDGRAMLKQSFTNPDTGDNLTINDFSTARYKVIVSVTEATATRRDKTVKAMLRTAEVAGAGGDMELAQAALVTAVMNQDGEGIADFQEWVRKTKALPMGLVKPTEDEAKAMAEAAQAEQAPDPLAGLADAQAEDAVASARKKLAEIPLIEAKTLQTLADAKAKADPAPLPTGVN